jgi:hypothetical protein
MRTNRAAYFADANALTRLGKALFRASEFIEHQGKLQSKRDRLRVHAVTPPDHRSYLEPARLICDGLSQPFKVIEENRHRLCQLHCKRRIEDI